MKRLFRFLFISVSFFITSTIFAQNGSVRGNISESFAGSTEPIIGAIINIEGTNKAAVTDTAGHFFIDNVPAGVYNVKVSYIGYDPKVIKGVEVISGQTANLPKILLNEDVTTTEEVEIIGTRDKSTEMSMIQEIKTLDVVASGISSEQIKRTMDRDASDVAKRVSGVSVVDNRFVIVRGLSERYNAVMINDVLAPSFEQDVKSFSLDNIQSSFIDRLIVYKSPSADLPGDFAGGVVKIFTKGMPVKNNFSIGFSSQYRNGTTFQDFKKLPEGKYGWLGYDDGKYGFPQGVPPDYGFKGKNKYDPYKTGALFRNDTWNPEDTKANPDVRMNISNGYRLKLGGGRVLGILSGINYSRTSEKWTDARQSLLIAENVDDSYTGPLKREIISVDNLDVHARTTRFSALQNFILQLNGSNTLEWKNLYTHVGLNRYRNAYRYIVSPTEYKKDPNSATYRSEVSLANSYGGILSSQLIGKFSVRKNTDVNWVLGYARAERDEPDLKLYSYVLDKNGYRYDLTNASPTPLNFGRLFFKTEEFVKTASTDITHRTIFNLFGQNEATFKGGMYLENKNRSFGARTFGYSAELPGETGVWNKAELSNLSPSDLGKETTWNNYNGLVISPSTQDGAYTASTDLYAFYGMTKLNWSDRLTISGGMRLENYTRIIRGNNLFIQNWLPSVNASYNFSKKILLRGSYGKTINRPELREASQFRTYDYYVRTNINGNDKLLPAEINNYDLRLEYYPSSNQAFSIGVFYKEFNKPIDRVLIQPVFNEPKLDNFDITFINASVAYSRGIEAEARTSFKDILFIKGKDALKNLTFVFNTALLQSRIIYDPASLSTSGVAGLDASGEGVAVQRNTKNFLAVNSNRSLLDQSPYMINAGLTYTNDSLKNVINVSYNIYGTRLFAAIPGVGMIYEVPRHVIDLSITQNIRKNIEIKFGIQDILNQKIQFVQDLNTDGKVKRIKGSGYETDLNNDKSIYQNSPFGGVSTIYVSPAPANASEEELKKNTYDVKDTEFLGFKRGSYYTLGVTFKF